jgi:hypothetical protein
VIVVDLDIVERLTGCGRLGGFDGTVYRLVPLEEAARQTAGGYSRSTRSKT